ncbi:MAG: hypothetical protein NZ779_11570, partial [Alteromonas macleodii]|nr:hypothetical protein [Alteromonas macleodii]
TNCQPCKKGQAQIPLQYVNTPGNSFFPPPAAQGFPNYSELGISAPTNRRAYELTKKFHSGGEVLQKP